MKTAVFLLAALVAVAAAGVRDTRQAVILDSSREPQFPARLQAALQPAALQSAAFQPAFRQPFQQQPFQQQSIQSQAFQQQPFQQQPFQSQAVQPQAFQQGFQPSFQQQPLWRILKQSQEFDPLGYYRFSFETENGIQVAEQGTVVRPGTSDESAAKQGSYSYTGPDGVQYTVTWVADENGYRASGAHLPTPPPVPEAILKSLEQNAREEGRFINKK